MFPTATHRSAGQGAWQVGPAFAAIYKGIPGLLLGGLVQNPISFAYTLFRSRVGEHAAGPADRVGLSRARVLREVRGRDVVEELEGRRADALPISLGLGYVMLREGWPPINVFVSGEWMAYRQQRAGGAADDREIRGDGGLPAVAPMVERRAGD